MYGSIPSFCWYAYFIWLGVQALEMEENSGSLSTKMADFLPSSTLAFHQLGHARKDTHLNTGSVKYHNKHRFT